MGMTCGGGGVGASGQRRGAFRRVGVRAVVAGRQRWWVGIVLWMRQSMGRSCGRPRAHDRDMAYLRWPKPGVIA
jgi:hypothetical protein